jgi:hypothetical protein
MSQGEKKDPLFFDDLLCDVLPTTRWPSRIFTGGNILRSHEMRIRLTYPNKSHETEDLRPLYEEFKRAKPEVFERWKLIEAKEKLSGPDELKPVSKEIQEFLKSRVEWESQSAISGAIADFRRLINKDLFDN